MPEVSLFLHFLVCVHSQNCLGFILFGDINTSIYITPIAESRSQSELNKTINELETERIVAADRGNINRESTLAQKRYEAEQLRDEIAAGFNKMYEASIVSTLFAYNQEDLDRLTKLLSTEMSKSLVGIKVHGECRKKHLKVIYHLQQIE